MNLRHAVKKLRQEINLALSQATRGESQPMQIERLVARVTSQKQVSMRPIPRAGYSRRELDAVTKLTKQRKGRLFNRASDAKRFIKGV